MKKYLTLLVFCLIAYESRAQPLKNYQVQAAESNPGLQAKYKAFEVAMQQIAQSKSLPDPTITISAFGQMVETRVGPQMARISLSQMFPWFGTLATSGDIAALKAEAEYQEFLNERNKLFYQVASAYYPLYELEEYIAWEKENIEILKSFKAIATTKFENDRGSLVDAFRVDLMLEESKTSLEILERKRVPLKINFNNLLNRGVEEKIEVQISPNLDRVEVSKDSLLRNNPKLNELELLIQANEQRVSLSKRQGLPTFGVGLDYILVGKREDLSPGQTIEGDGQDAIMPMITVGLPIFRGKYRASENEARLMTESISLQKEDQINQLISDFESAKFERDQQLSLIELYDAQIAQTQRIQNLLFSAYANSGKDFEELLSIHQQLLKYKKMKATAFVTFHIAAAKLNYLMAKEY